MEAGHSQRLLTSVTILRVEYDAARALNYAPYCEANQHRELSRNCQATELLSSAKKM